MAIKKYHVSKNLFDKNNADIYPSTNISTSLSRWAAYEGIAQTVRIPCSANTTYAISIDSAIEQTIFRGLLINTDNVPAIESPVSGTVAISSSDDNTAVFTTLADTKYLVLQVSATVFNDAIDSLMLVAGSTPQTYEPYGYTWNSIPYRKYGTETDTLTSLPADVIADGQSASADIIGNMVQSGTPTPTAPIRPQECGDLETTGERAGQYKIPIKSGGVITPVYLGEVETTRKIGKLVLDGTENWLLEEGDGRYSLPNITSLVQFANQLCTHFQSATSYSDFYFNDLKFGVSNRPCLLIHYIACQTVSAFKAFLASEYATGHPVTVWYILATPTTGILNEPIRKIGDYADSISVSNLPTTGTSEQFNINTTLKPSEVQLTYHGWHEHNDEKFVGGTT